MRKKKTGEKSEIQINTAKRQSKFPSIKKGTKP